MALALNNLKRVDMPLNKETKPSIIAGTLGIVPKDLEKRLEDLEIIMPIALLKTTRRLQETCCPLDSCEKFPRSEIIIMFINKHKENISKLDLMNKFKNAFKIAFR